MKEFDRSYGWLHREGLKQCAMNNRLPFGGLQGCWSYKGDLRDNNVDRFALSIITGLVRTQ
jgi:hypothetical protein